MMQNLTQIAQLMKGRDPQAVALSMIQNSKITDPNINQLVSLAQKGDTESVLNLATNLFAQRGLDLKQELNSFMELMK